MNIPDLLIEKFVSDDKDAHVMMKTPWLDVENKRLLCTNGHVASRISICTNEFDVSGVIPIEVFQLARKELKAISKAVKDELPDPWLSVNCLDDVIEVENLLTNTKHLVVRPVIPAEVKYPKIDAVFPDSLGDHSVCLSVEYMRKIMVAIDGFAGVSVWVQAKDKPVILASSDGKGLVAVMPMRVEIIENIAKRGEAKKIESAQTDEQ